MDLWSGTICVKDPLYTLNMYQATAEILSRLVQSLTPRVKGVVDELDEAMHEHMQQFAEHLNWLLQELEQRKQELSGALWGALLSAGLQKWQYWVTAGVLVLLSRSCWRLKERRHQPDKSSKISSRKEADEEQEENRSFLPHVSQISAERRLELPKSLNWLDRLMDELLRTCRKIARKNLMPLVEPAIWMGSVLQGGSPRKGDAAYCLLVALKPPCGHNFHLEPSPIERMSVRKCSLHVELECTCRGEPPVENMLCFRHHPQEELRKNQSPSLLDTLCTGPYLDMEKTMLWFQILVRAAWVFLPQSRHCQLIVLPSRHSCKLQLINASNRSLVIEMVFGV